MLCWMQVDGIVKEAGFSRWTYVMWSCIFDKGEFHNSASFNLLVADWIFYDLQIGKERPRFDFDEFDSVPHKFLWGWVPGYHFQEAAYWKEMFPIWCGAKQSTVGVMVSDQFVLVKWGNIKHVLISLPDYPGALYLSCI